MDRVDKSRKENARAVWVTPMLSELGVGQTLNGQTQFTAELFDADRNPVTRS